MSAQSKVKIPRTKIPTLSDQLSPEEVEVLEADGYEILLELIDLLNEMMWERRIWGEEDLTIQGQVEGTIDLKKNHVTIGRTGRIKAAVYGRRITIEGEVQGNLFGEERIVLRQSGRVLGDMRSPAINLEEGAKFKGSIDMDSKGEQQPTPKELPVEQAPDDENVPGPNKSVLEVKKLASFVILLAMSPVLLVLVVVSMTYVLSALLAISGILE